MDGLRKFLEKAEDPYKEKCSKCGSKNVASHDYRSIVGFCNDCRRVYALDDKQFTHNLKIINGGLFFDPK